MLCSAGVFGRFDLEGLIPWCTTASPRLSTRRVRRVYPCVPLRHVKSVTVTQGHFFRGVPFVRTPERVSSWRNSSEGGEGAPS